MRLCLIPARGGSKRIPRKNVRNFRGRPIISWSINAAKLSGLFDQIIVSTDDQEIAAVASESGAFVPFVRPMHLADDYSTTHSVVLHALNWADQDEIECESLCCLYATAPFVRPDDLQLAQNLLTHSKSNTVVFAATSYVFPIQRALSIDSEGYSHMLDPSMFLQRSQDLKQAYHDAGQFYFAAPDTWRQRKNLFEHSKPLLLPRWRVQDIDTEEDWRQAELMHQLIEDS